MAPHDLLPYQRFACSGVHIAIPRSSVSKELYNFNTNVLRVAVHLKEQRWAGFGRFAGSKLGWVRISA